MPKIRRKIKVSPEDMQICIPSYKRYENISSPRSNSVTIKNLPRFMLPVTSLYVDKSEMDMYFRRIEGPRFGQISLKAAINGIWGNIMDQIISEATAETLIIMDDDLSFGIRRDLEHSPSKIEKDITDEEWMNAFLELAALCEDYPLSSFQYRQFCQGKTERHACNQRMSMVWGLNTKFFQERRDTYNFSKLNYMSDYVFFMDLLNDGIENRCINRITKNDRPNAPGGINDAQPRDLEPFNRDVMAFAAMFPEYVSAYVKNNKSSWEDGHMGVRIQAARCLADALKRKAI